MTVYHKNIQKMHAMQVPPTSPRNNEDLEVVVKVAQKAKFDDFLITSCIGRGNFGEIFRAKHKTEKGECALKIIPMEKIETK